MSQSMRQVARRVFAREFNAATYTFSESDDEYAPVYALLPTGQRLNRAFIVGTLTETEEIGDEQEYWRGRILEPTGTVYAYAGEYQPEAAATLRQLTPPAHVAVLGKPRTYETDDGGTNVSLRAETISHVEQDVRKRWIVETARQTLDRIRAFEEGEEPDVIRAHDIYGDDIDLYLDAVIAALEELDIEDAPEMPS